MSKSMTFSRWFSLGAIRLDFAACFALLLMLLQLITGTSFVFAELTFLAIMCSVLAVNLAGGVRTIAGACFAIVALQVFVLAEIAKVLYAEAGQSRLEAPIETIGVIALSMASLCIAGLLCLGLNPRRFLFRPTVDPELLRVVAVLSFLLGLGSMMGGHLAGETDEGAIRLGGIAGLLRRFSGCVPLAVIAGTAYTLLISGRRRLFSSYNLVPLVSHCALGIFYSSKQGIFEPVLCLVLTSIAFRYSWHPAQLCCGFLALLFALFVLFPLAQVSRNHTRGVNFGDNLQKNVEYFSENLKNPRYFLDQYDEYTEGLQAEGGLLYFDKPNGVLERMSLIKPADSLVSATIKKGESSWKSIWPGLLDLLPRAILPRRWVNVPNDLGYKAGIVDEDNFGTCISFGFAADAFSSFGWGGVAVISILLGTLIMTVTRFLTPAMPYNVWGIFFFVSYHHMVAEAPIGAILNMFITQTAWVVLSLAIILFTARTWICLNRQKPRRAETIRHLTQRESEG